MGKSTGLARRFALRVAVPKSPGDGRPNVQAANYTAAGISQITLERDRDGLGRQSEPHFVRIEPEREGRRCDKLVKIA